MQIACVWEHHGNDTLLYAANVAGAFTRGPSKEEALRKMGEEVAAFRRWQGLPAVTETERIVIVQEKASELNIADADSDVLFACEALPLTQSEYDAGKRLSLKSAADFYALYRAFPDKNASVLPLRQTFYGTAPRTAEEMYQHTKNVNSYYFGEIGVEADDGGTILECRARGFEALEQTPNYLQNPVCVGSYGEEWSLRKVLRRFIWHDRIHAKAMYRMGLATFGRDAVPDIFRLNG